MIEQRAHPRIPVSWPVRVGGHATGTTFNVSLSGILFLTSSRKEIGDIVELDIAVRHNDFVRCTARIVRKERTSKEQCHAYAAVFIDFQEYDGWVLANILRRMTSHTPVTAPAKSAAKKPEENAPVEAVAKAKAAPSPSAVFCPRLLHEPEETWKERWEACRRHVREQVNSSIIEFETLEEMQTKFDAGQFSRVIVARRGYYKPDFHDWVSRKRVTVVDAMMSGRDEVPDRELATDRA